MAQDQNSVVRAARPKISVDGREREELTGGLLGLSVVEELAGLYRCEAMFGNWGTAAARRQANRTFSISTGRRWSSASHSRSVYDDEVLFDGRIMALEAHFPEGEPRTMTVLAEDRFQDLRMARRNAHVDRRNR